MSYNGEQVNRKECSSIEKDNLSLEESINSGYTNLCFYGTYKQEDCFVKVSRDSEVIQKEFESLKLVNKHTNIQVPEPIKTVESGEIYALLTSVVDISKPSEEDWQNVEFCKSIVDSGADVLNQVICNSELQSSAQNSEYCSSSVCRINELYEPAHKRLINGSVEMSDKARTLDAIRQSIVSSGYIQRFSHNDFTINNYGYSDGVQPVFDWENSGFYSPLFDISSFETGVIEEYIDYFHSTSFTQQIKNRFHDRLEYKIDRTNLYNLFKLFNILSVIGYLNNSSVSDIWVSTLDEAIDVKMRQYEDYVRKTNLAQ